jgi:hypothetical protein
MCGMCGLLQASAHWSHADAASGQARRRRLLQVAKANRLLHLFRLELRDFHGQSYLLIGPTGASQLVSDFGALWAAAEQLLGRPIDPLAMPWPAPMPAP